MPRHLFIVSRRNPELYTYLCVRFADDERAQVILDRRHGERRQTVRPLPEIERRRANRRARRDIERQLETASHVIVTLD